MIDLSDQRTFKNLYEQHFAGMKYFAMRFVESEDAACDILQDLFVKLWEKGERFPSDQAFLVYLYRSLRNRCLTFLRDARRREIRMAGFEQEESEESFLSRIIEAEVYALVNDVFAGLPDSSKNVYVKSLEGKSHKEIADELHIAVNTIKKHKNNANRYLKSRLKKLFLLIAMVG